MESQPAAHEVSETPQSRGTSHLESDVRHADSAGASDVVHPGCFSGRTPKKFLMAIFLGASLVLHLVLIEGIYMVVHQDNKDTSHVKKKEQQERVKTFAISLPEPLKKERIPKAEATKPAEPEKTSSPPKTPKRHAAINPQKQGKPKALEIGKMSASMLETLGKQHMHLVKKGAFPPLTLSYSDPEVYIRQMYRIGGKTLILQETKGLLYEIDLLKGRIMPLSKKDLAGFSAIKRVIRDSRWDALKTRAASRLKARIPELVIILALPQNVETRWVGHQVSVIRQAGIPLEQVQGVEALFKDGRLQVISLHLGDGSERKIRDPGSG